jgi:TolB protein
MVIRRLRAASIALVCATGLSALACPSAGAAFPGKNGELVFTSVQDGPRHILETSGSGVLDLTGASSHVAETQPAFSPNGKRIAFTRSHEIWVMSASGHNPTRLTKAKSVNGDPAWSPDGKRIAFVSNRRSKYDVWVMHRDGTHAKRLTHNSAIESELVWSPTGKAIAFQRAPASGGASPAVYSMKPDGSHVRLLASSAVEPDYSPDGSMIVYSGPYHPSPPGSEGPDLWTMRSNGANKAPLIHEGSSFYSDGSYPTWSPDGSTIAFAANNGTGYLHVFEVPAAGGTSTPVVTNNDNGNPLDQELDWQALAH